MNLCPLTTREAVKAALEAVSSTRANWQVDEAIASATSAVEGPLHRSFRPVVATHTFPWPPLTTSTPTWRLWLDDHEVISITTLTVAGSVVSPANYKLAPSSGPPYSNVQANISTIGAFDAGSTWQEAISITGLFGYRNDETAVGTVAEALDASETGVDVSNGARIGVGDLLRVDSERMIVTDRSWLDSTATLSGNQTASMAERSVGVSNGALLNAGELIQVDAETMLVESISGNTLTVRRAQDGSVLASHSTSAAVRVSRSLTVERGALGTTAATHSLGAALYRHDVPPGVRRLARAEALVTLDAEHAAYAGSVGEGGNERTLSGNSIDAARELVRIAYGRKGRFR